LDAVFAHRVITKPIHALRENILIFRFLLENLEPKDETPIVNLKIVIEPGEDGYFVAHCPALKSCWSQGKTREEALKNVREAIDLYLTPAEGSLARRRG
jgi:predicted RNase H-like HicB family nuclease